MNYNLERMTNHNNQKMVLLRERCTKRYSLLVVIYY